MNQPELEFAPVVPEAKENSIFARFQRFHVNNPEVYNNLVRLAREFRSKGSNHNRTMGIGMLYEVLRWNYYLSIDSIEEYRLSNDFRASYARLIMATEPDLKDAFNTRITYVD